MAIKVGLLGWPVAHSISPAIHNRVFQMLGMDWQYTLLPVELDELFQKVDHFAEAGYRGFNVTIPHKRRILELPQLELVDKDVQAIGAANTLALTPSGGWRANNTDWEGFKRDLQSRQIGVEGRNCILLGWGGAARAVRYALDNMGAGKTWVISRRPNDLENVYSYEVLPDLARQADFIVNCTPLGMPPQEDISPWPEQIEFPAHAILYDLIYNPAATRLMRTAQKAGARVVGGIGMLANQAALSFRQWTGEEPPFELYHEAARKALRLAVAGA